MGDHRFDESDRADMIRYGRSRIIAAFGLLVLFYFAAGVSNRFEAVDTLAFSADAEVSPFWSNPDARMLLFYRVNRIAVRALEGLGLDLDVYTVLGLLGSLFAAASVLLLYRLLKVAFRLSEPASLAGALTLAVSYGFLRYASEVEVYVGATFLLLASLNLLFHSLDRATPSVGRIAFAGIVSGLAVTYYQPLAIPLFIAAAILFAGKRWYGHYLLYGAVGSATYVVSVVLALWAELGRIPTLVDLRSLFLARSGEFEPPGFGVLSFVKAAQAILHDVASLSWLYGMPGAEDIIRRHLPHHYYYAEELFFAARSYGLVWIAAGTFLITAAWFIHLLIASARRQQSRRIDSKIILLGVWMAIASAVNLVLNPAEKEVWIVLLPAIAIAVAVFVYEPLKARKWQLAAMVGLLLVHNLVGGIGIFRNEGRDLYAQRTSWLRQHGARGDWILTTGPANDWFNRMRILRYPLVGKSDRSVKDEFFNFMYFDGRAAAVQRWAKPKYTWLGIDEMLVALKTSGNRIFVFDETLDPRPLPARLDHGDRYRKLVEFGRFLEAYATVVDDGPHGKTFEIDKSKLPAAMTRN